MGHYSLHMSTIRSKYMKIIAIILTILSYSSASDIYKSTIEKYYSLLHNKQYSSAYDLLSNFKLTYYDADGSGGSFRPRQKYEQWLVHQKNIDSLAIIDIKEMEYWKHSSGSIDRKKEYSYSSGHRCYKVELYTSYITEEKNSPWRSGVSHYFIWLVKGVDERVTILGIGTGP